MPSTMPVFRSSGDNLRTSSHSSRPLVRLIIFFYLSLHVAAQCPIVLNGPCTESVQIYPVGSSIPNGGGQGQRLPSSTPPTIHSSTAISKTPPPPPPPSPSVQPPITSRSDNNPVSSTFASAPIQMPKPNVIAPMPHLTAPFLPPSISMSSSQSSGSTSVPDPTVSSGLSSASTAQSSSNSSSGCGYCKVYVTQVQVYYWPTATVRSDCARASGLIQSQDAYQYGANASRTLNPTIMGQGAAKSTIDVVDGNTFTFPTVYISFIGDVAISNSCGMVGTTHPSPTPIAVPAITTASYPAWPSTCRDQDGYGAAVLNTLAQSDIACPTWGLSNPFQTSCGGSSYLTATYGPPYNPVILAPPQLLDIDPAWAVCRQEAQGPFTLPCGIYDPPRVLSTAAGMGPPAPGATPPPDPTNAGLAQPGGSATNGLPGIETNGPDSDQHAHNPAGQMGPGNVPSPSGGSPDSVLPLAAQAPSPQMQAQSQPALQGQGDPGSGGPITPQDPVKPQPEAATPPIIFSTTINLNTPQPPPSATANVGSFVNNGFGAAGPIGNPSSASSGTSPVGEIPIAFVPHAITSFGQTISVASPNPSIVAIAGTSLAVGGPALTTDGQVFSLAPSGSLVAGVFDSNAAGIAAAATPGPLTIDGAIISPNANSQYIIGGQTLSPGSAITVSGTYVSEAANGGFAVVGSSTQILTSASSQATLSFNGAFITANTAGQFIIGSQTLTPGGTITVSGTPISEATNGAYAIVGTTTESLLPTPTTGDLVTIDGQTITASPSGFVVNGTTILPGGTAAVIGGTTVSLGPSGSLLVGTSTIDLPTGTTGPTVFEGGAANMKMRVFGDLFEPKVFLFLILIGYTLFWTLL